MTFNESKSVSLNTTSVMVIFYTGVLELPTKLVEPTDVLILERAFPPNDISLLYIILRKDYTIYHRNLNTYL